MEFASIHLASTDGAPLEETDKILIVACSRVANTGMVCKSYVCSLGDQLDDLNLTTQSLFRYPDTKTWDPDRNTEEFIAAMPKWYEKGLRSFTLNMQGGQPGGFENWYQHFINRGYNEDGTLHPGYMKRLKRILDKADDMGMIVMLGYFYWGQDQHLKSKESVLAATRNLTEWLVEQNYTNVLVEVSNECDIATTSHEILYYRRVHELVRLVQEVSQGKLLASASMVVHPTQTNAMLDTCDYVLFHGNGVNDPMEIRSIAKAIRENPHYRGTPLVVNEDDHFDFEKDVNNMKECVRHKIGWGYFDWPGYQKVPNSWEIDTPRKKAFFDLLQEMVG